MRPFFRATSVFCWTCVVVLGAQGPTYDHPVDFRLEEVAAKLNVPAPQVLNARIALRKATESVDIITPHTSASLSPYINLWKQVDPDSLPGAFTYLFYRLQHDASTTDRSRDYEWSTAEATGLLSELAVYDPGLATELAQSWPEPAPEFTRRARDTSRWFWDSILDHSLALVAKKDAERALELEAEIQPAICFQSKGEIVARLFHEGHSSEAEDLARETMREYRNAEVDNQLFLDFCAFTDRLASVSRGLFEEAWTLLLEKGYENESARPAVHTADGSKISFSVPEYMGLIQLRFRPVGWIPGLLERFPDLQDRIERIGGIEVVWRTAIHQLPRLDSVSADTASAVQSKFGTQSVSAIARLAAERRDDARARSARDFIRNSMSGDLPLRDRAVMAVSFLQAHRHSELDHSEIAAIGNVLDELEDFNLDQLADDRDVLPETDEFRLETELLVLWSRNNFEDAMRRIEANPNRRFRTLLYLKIPGELML